MLSYFSLVETGVIRCISEVGVETSYVRDSSDRNHEAGFTRLDL